MSDAEGPAEVRGGPIWSRQPSAPSTPPPPPPPPSAPGAANPPTHFLGATDPSGRRDELYQPEYSRTSGTPIPYLVGALALMAAAAWAWHWSELVPGATDPVKSSEWWTNITAVLLPGEDVRFASYSDTRMWVTLALLLLAATVVVLWIGRIGSNLRSGQQPFGAFLPIVAFPAWWLLPISIGSTTDATRTRGDLLVRFLVAFALIFAQFLLMRWPTLNRIWRAGRLPYDLASILLWLPMMIPWLMYFGSTAFSLLAVGERGSLSDSAWRPTPAMLDWARSLTRVSAVATLILLVVVSVVQHLGVARDRAALEASRQRSHDERLPLLPPSA